MLNLRRTGPFPWGPTVFFLAWVWAPGLSRAAVTCVGDCHREGAVTLGDLVTLVNIALHPTQLTDCEAGDANGDQSIAVDEIVTAATNALYGCVALHVGSAAGAPGAQVQFAVTLNAGSWEVLGTDNCVALPPGVSIATTASGKLDCTVNPGIGKNGTFFQFNTFFCPNELEAFVTASPASGVAPIPNGAQLYTCHVKIAPDASPGSKALTCPNAEASAAYLSTNSHLVTAGCTDGAVTVSAP